MRGVVGKSMMWNPYPYALGNPVNYTDPSGRNPWLLTIGIGSWVGLAMGAIDLASQVINNLNNGREPFECIDLNSVLESMLVGFVLWTLIAKLPPPMAGGLLVGGENLINQVNHIIDQGRATNFFDALDEVDWLNFASDTILGIAGGWALGTSGAMQIGALLGIQGYILGIVALNASGKSVNPTIRDIYANAFFGGALAYANAGLSAVMSMLEMSVMEQMIFYGFIGVESLALQHVLTDDNPLESSQEKGSLLYGGLNALSIIPGQPGIFITIIANTVINTKAGSVDS